jgi:hypothetical protein
VTHATCNRVENRDASLYGLPFGIQTKAPLAETVPRDAGRGCMCSGRRKALWDTTGRELQVLLRAKLVYRLLKPAFGALPDLGEQFFRLRVISNADQVFIGRAGKTFPGPSLARLDGPNRAVVVGGYFHQSFYGRLCFSRGKLTKPACGISPHSIRRPPLPCSKKAACARKWTPVENTVGVLTFPKLLTI